MDSYLQTFVQISICFVRKVLQKFCLKNLTNELFKRVIC